MTRARRAGGRGHRTILTTMGATALLASSAIVSGCSSDSACVTTRAYFEQNVWSAFMGTQCTKCHSPGGPAVAAGAKLVLEPSSYPGFIDANIATLQEVSKIQYEGVSEILLKPIGEMQHGGGTQIDKGSPEYDALVDLVKRFDTGDSCADQPSLTLQGVTELNAASTFRKAALNLGGRLPTDAETSQLQAGGDAALDPLLDALFKEDMFATRIKEIYNDSILTNKYMQYDGQGVDLIDENVYPAAAAFKDPNGAFYGDPRKYAGVGVAQEPLELIAYVTKSDMPFTDILTANYTMVNPFSAKMYGTTPMIPFADPTNPKEYQPAQVVSGGSDDHPTMVPIPHAGVLSTPAFLERWPTTPTNRSRARARRVFLYFLATDILKIADRPVDATKVTMEENPTHNSDLCTVCHKIIDPVAGGFRGYDENDYQFYDPTANWHDEMFSPGFGTATMDPGSYTTALQWLTAQVAADPRFVISVVQTVYRGLTGQDEVAYPADPSVADFDQKLAAWTAQDQFFRGVGDDFVKNNYNVKTVFKDIIKSTYYRATNVSGDADPGSLDNVGTGHFLTPETLDRKITAVVGSPWGYWDDNNMVQHHTLLEDYPILYGGIDSDSTITRLTAPNGVTANVAQRMANEMACEVTAVDFALPKDQRRFFKFFDLDEQPESAGHPVDASIADIKANIQYLHKLILDEDLDIDDPEIDRTYQLYVQTYRELALTNDTNLQYDCQGRTDHTVTPPVDLPDAMQIKSDDKLTIKPWQAVMTYLLSDYKFITE